MVFFFGGSLRKHIKIFLGKYWQYGETLQLLFSYIPGGAGFLPSTVVFLSAQ